VLLVKLFVSLNLPLIFIDQILTAPLEIIRVAASKPKVFATNDRSTYSNVAFSLLSQTLERATGRSYSQIITSSILEPLGMNNTWTVKPEDSFGIIPWGPNDWAQELGADTPHCQAHTGWEGN
jgi:CubicO group peptidase (beta-lactamase class C family)